MYNHMKCTRLCLFMRVYIYMQIVTIPFYVSARLVAVLRLGWVSAKVSLLHRLSSMSKLLDEHLSVSNNGWLHVTQLLRLASENQNSAFTAHIVSRETIAQDEQLTSSQLLQLCKWYQNLPSPQTDNISSAQLAKQTANGRFSLDVKSDKAMNNFDCQVFPHACNAFFPKFIHFSVIHSLRSRLWLCMHAKTARWDLRSIQPAKTDHPASQRNNEDGVACILHIPLLLEYTHIHVQLGLICKTLTPC